MASMDVLCGQLVSLRELTADNLKDYPSPHAGDYSAFTDLWSRPPHPLEKVKGARLHKVPR